jgi:hypothetical protein
MKKLIIIRKVLKELYPELKVLVRYNQKKYFEIILKNVKGAYVDNMSYKYMLTIPGCESMVIEDFVTTLFGYCSILNEDNCVIKYLDKKGSRTITKTLP